MNPPIPLPDASTPRYCFACGNAIGNRALSCPACHQLIHAWDVEQIAAEARALEANGDLPGAALQWKKALDLLPADSQEAAAIRDHRASLGARTRIAIAQSVDSPVESPPKKQRWTTEDWKKRFGPIGVVLAFFAKFKTAALLLITKGKFLLFGLTKVSTLLSMFASMGLYWALYGWKFGMGFVLGIYVHEMGHVWALRHFGLRASAPMFIPGFGAFVSLYDSPANHGQDARIGLAGPIWGTGAALAAALPWVLNGGGLWLALRCARLYQFVQSDSDLAARRRPRLPCAQSRAAFIFDRTDARAVVFRGIGNVFDSRGGGAYRVFWAKDQPMEGDRGAFLQYAGLLICSAQCSRG